MEILQNTEECVDVLLNSLDTSCAVFSQKSKGVFDVLSLRETESSDDGLYKDQGSGTADSGRTVNDDGFPGRRRRLTIRPF